MLVEALAVAAVAGSGFRFFDEQEYDRLARALLDGHGYVGVDGFPTAYRPPGYPLLLAALYAIHEAAWVARIFNAVALALAAWLLSRVAARLHPFAGPLVPFLFLCYPVFAYTASTLYPQTTALLLLSASIALLLTRPPAVTRCAAAGALYGALMLCVPLFAALLPVLVAAAALGGGASARGSVRAAAFVVSALLTLTPWTMRNYDVFDRFVFVSTNGGVNLLLGNSERAEPHAGVRTDISRYTRLQPAEADEPERNAWFAQQALAWITANPRDAARLYAGKVLHFFTFAEALATEREQRSWHGPALLVTYYPLLLLAVARLFAMRRRPLAVGEALLYAIYLGGALATAVFFPRIRFRVPFDGLLVVLAAVSLASRLEGPGARFRRGIADRRARRRGSAASSPVPSS